MNTKLLLWDLYTISSKNHKLTGIMLRGRIRKLCLQNNINVLAENSADTPGELCFAVLENQDISIIKEYLKTLFEDIKIEPLTKQHPNPILTKIQLNFEDRYDI